MLLKLEELNGGTIITHSYKIRYLYIPPTPAGKTPTSCQVLTTDGRLLNLAYSAAQAVEDAMYGDEPPTRTQPPTTTPNAS